MDEDPFFQHFVTLQILSLDRAVRISNMMDVNLSGKIADWCMEKVGRDNFSFGWEYPGTDSHKYYRIRFKNGEDAVACKLKWGDILI